MESTNNSSDFVNEAAGANKFSVVQEARELCETGKKNLIAGDTEEAVRNFKKATIKDPNNPFNFYFLAKAYQSMAKKEGSSGFYVLAMENIRKAVSMAPDTVTFHNLRLEIAVKAGVIEDILKEYIELSAKNPQNNFYKEFIKKISIVNMIPLSDIRSVSNSKRNILLVIFFDYLFPVAGCMFFSAGYMIHKYVNPESKIFTFHPLLFRVGLILLAIFIGVKLFKFVKFKQK